MNSNNKFKLAGKGRWWYNFAPPHRQEKVEKEECRKMLSGGGYLVVNTFDFDCQEETRFWWVVKDHFGGMEELSAKVRNQVRKALKTYDIEKVSGQEIARIGTVIGNKAMDGYKIKGTHYTQEQMDKYVDAPKEIEFWAVYTKEDHLPVAFAVNTIENGECVGYNKMKCDPAYQHNSTYPYYGLIYEMNRHYLQERGMRYVNDGRRSLTEHSNIQPFLIEKFKFRRAFCKLQIEYKWWVGIVVNMTYPFRRFIKHPTVIKLLRQEAMRRGEY